MPTGSRTVLYANIGKYDLNSVVRNITTANPQFFKDTDTSGTAAACTVFAQRGLASLAIGDPVLTSFKANQPFFVRRIRIASEQQAYGVKLLNVGGWGLGAGSATPVRLTNSSYFQLWANKLSDNSQAFQIYEADTCPLLNEWYDVNILVPSSGGGSQNNSLFLTSVYNIEVDYTDVPSRALAFPIQLRLEVEVDFGDTALNASPIIPPTIAQARRNWTLNNSVLTSVLGAIQTYRTSYLNTFGQPIKTLQAGYIFAWATGNCSVNNAYVGTGTPSGSFNLDMSVWSPLLFGGNPNLVPPGGYDMNSVGTILSDVLTLGTPIGIGSQYVISSVMSAGNFTSGEVVTGQTDVTPNTGTLINPRFQAGAHGNDAGQSWTFNGAQPQFILLAGF
jgi:hypothetical protein